jgi:hypothetical protein
MVDSQPEAAPDNAVFDIDREVITADGERLAYWEALDRLCWP